MDSQNKKAGNSKAGTFAREKDDFDFDTWAVAVRRQMLESLRKRGSR